RWLESPSRPCARVQKAGVAGPGKAIALDVAATEDDRVPRLLGGLTVGASPEARQSGWDRTRHLGCFWLWARANRIDSDILLTRHYPTQPAIAPRTPRATLGCGVRLLQYRSDSYES